MDKYYKNGDLIYIWNDAYEKCEISKLTSSFKELIINSNTGNGGTQSEKIAEIAKDVKEYREHLVIITDGEVEEDSINESTRILKEENIKFKYVTTFIIGNKGNLSVGAP